MKITSQIIALTAILGMLSGCASAPSIPHNQNLVEPEVSSYIFVGEEISFSHDFGGLFNMKRVWYVPPGRYVAVAENEIGVYYQREDSEIRFVELGIEEKWPGGIYVNKSSDVKQVYIYPKKGVGPVVPLGYMLSPHGSVPVPSSVIPDEISRILEVQYD